MIGKVTRGKNVGGLLRYLFGPGRANEHTNPHLVASWLGKEVAVLAALEPLIVGTRRDVSDLAARLALPLQLQPTVDRPVWQCSMRVSDVDRELSDAEWASIARDVVHRTGFAPRSDAAGCRWVAVRHADDHIHIAVVLARMDGQPVEVYRDWPKVHAAARAAERRYGLRRVETRTQGVVTPTRGELEKSARASSAEPTRTWLMRQVREAASSSTTRQQFIENLEDRGVVIAWRTSERVPGQITGVSFGRLGDLDTQGRQIRFGGSKLAGDLSLRRLGERWATSAATRASGAHAGHTGHDPRVAEVRSHSRSRRSVASAFALIEEVTQDDARHALRIALNAARVAEAVRPHLHPSRRPRGSR